MPEARRMGDTVTDTDAATGFFEQLARRGHEPLLAKARGTVAVELTNGAAGERWLVTIKRGAVNVVRSTGDADCTLRAARGLFERIAAGEVNAVAAFLRGEVAVAGDWNLLVLFQRLFPSPPRPGAAKPDTAAGGPSR